MKLCFMLLVLALVKGSEGGAKCGQPRNSGSSSNIKSFPNDSSKDKLVRIPLPCKYNAVRQRCGQYLISVTPGLGEHGDRIRLETMNLDIEDLNENVAWKGSSDNKRAVEFINNPTGEEPFEKTDGDQKTSTFLKREVEVDGAKYRRAVVKIDEVFKLTYMPYDPHHDHQTTSEWSFECFDSNFATAPYPGQVCGAAKAKEAVEFMTDVLNETETSIDQHVLPRYAMCQQAEDLFQDVCDDDAARGDAMDKCGQLLIMREGDIPGKKQCVVKRACSAMEVFVTCLDWACSGYKNNTVCAHLAATVDPCFNNRENRLVMKIQEVGCYNHYVPLIH